MTDDTERLSVLTISLYAAWNIGLGLALLRVRIDPYAMPPVNHKDDWGVGGRPEQQ